MTKISEWQKKENLEKITDWASDRTKTVADIAHLMGISPSTLHLWLKERKKIKKAFDDGRVLVDDCAENQFMKMCFGYNVRVKKPKKVRRWKLDEKGKRVEEYEEYIEVDEEIHIPACWPALQVYLLNRMPDKYRPINAIEAPEDDDENKAGVVIMPEIEMPKEEIIDAEIVGGDSSLRSE